MKRTTTTRVLSLVLVLAVMLSSVLSLASCEWLEGLFGKKYEGAGDYTYRSYTTAFGTNWNPHTWETSADSSMASYLESPFVTMEAKDTELGVYQWVYEMATEIKDVTAEHQDDLTKYGVTLPKGTAASEVTEGYVYEIKLNPDAKWQNGDLITADDYIYSMEMLLNSKMRNYRANLYISGESAVAGGLNFYNSEAPIYAEVYDWDTNTEASSGPYFLDLKAGWSGNSNYSIEWMYTNGYIYDAEDDAETPDVDESKHGATYYEELAEQANLYGYVPVTEENQEKVDHMLTQFLAAFGIPAAGAPDYFITFYYYNTGLFGDKVEYDTVGCYKVDDYTIRYVCQTALELNYFLTSCTSTWLVHKATYEAGLDKSGELWVTNYGTSPETSMSYGVYKFESFQNDKQVVFVQNENWYGWEKDENGNLKLDDEGNLISYTSYHGTLDGGKFLVDGQALRQHQIEKVVIDKMDEAAAKAAFLKGELSDWSPSAAELVQYSASDRLYKVDETYTMSLFFNTNENDLLAMDEGGNQNSLVLTSTNFRKAFSLGIDRAKFVTATEGYKPAFALMNSLYHYDFYNDPNSSYRNTNQAKQAILDLYGVEWGEGTDYATIDEAVDSVTGYNLAEAKNLMKAACDELVAAGKYTAGEPVYIKMAWSKAALDSSANQQITLLNEFINAAAQGSGFGTITLEGIGNLEDRYGDVPAGNYAIGYGAWGGAALYPFRNMQVYMDPSQYDINEAACWNPAVETLTLTVNGEEVTMTWQAWSNSMIGTGAYANADNETKLTITAMLETKFLEKYYRIPLCGTTVCSMLSYQLDYYTQEYNLAYGFGGSRLMSFNYDDAEWAKFIDDNNGKLSYE